MSSSSSSTSRQTGRRSVLGVPSKCWCGHALDTWVSETKENPYRRFYRCKIALQNKTESHLFKWVDEAIIDEIRIVDARRIDLVHQLQALQVDTKAELDSQQRLFTERTEAMHEEFSEKMRLMSASIADASTLLQKKIDAEFTKRINAQIKNDGNIFKMASVVGLIGAMSYLYWKLL